MKQFLGRNQAKNGVPEKFKLFVVANSRLRL
jgi:hypothetical protein